MNDEADLSKWASMIAPLYVFKLNEPSQESLASFGTVASALRTAATFVYVLSDTSELRVYHDGKEFATLGENELFKRASMEAFVRRTLLPLVSTLSTENYRYFIDSTTGYNKHATVWIAATSSEYSLLKAKMEAAARVFRDDSKSPVYFAWVDAEQHARLLWSK